MQPEAKRIAWSPHVLIVDGESRTTDKLCQLLRSERYQADAANSVEAARQRLQLQLYDVVLAEPKLRDERNLDVFSLCQEIDPSLPLLWLVPWSILQPHSPGSAENLRDAVAKPVRRDDLLAAIERVLDSSRLRCEARDLWRRLEIAPSFNGLLGRDPALLEEIKRAKQLARGNMPVLIRGENGTGKELMARAIHVASPRGARPLVTAFLASEPKELQLSALFGHLKGAFTGALTARRGWFREAHLSTLFLDEVGDILPETQGALLRVLDKYNFKVIGEDHEQAVDVRIISATNRNLQADVRNGRFRQDLYYRLGGDNAILLPPLRERRDDVPLLLEHFVRQVCGPNRQPPVFDSETHQALCHYAWPGNVRELKYKTEFALQIAGDGPLALRHFQLPDLALDGAHDIAKCFEMPLKAAQAAFTNQYLQRLLKKFGDDKKRAAEAAGVDVSTIRRLLRDERELTDEAPK